MSSRKRSRWTPPPTHLAKCSRNQKRTGSKKTAYGHPRVKVAVVVNTPPSTDSLPRRMPRPPTQLRHMGDNSTLAIPPRPQNSRRILSTRGQQENKVIDSYRPKLPRNLCPGGSTEPAASSSIATVQDDHVRTALPKAESAELLSSHYKRKVKDISTLSGVKQATDSGMATPRRSVTGKWPVRTEAPSKHVSRARPSAPGIAFHEGRDTTRKRRPANMCNSMTPRPSPRQRSVAAGNAGVMQRRSAHRRSTVDNVASGSASCVAMPISRPHSQRVNAVQPGACSRSDAVSPRMRENECHTRSSGILSSINRPQTADNRSHSVVGGDETWSSLPLASSCVVKPRAAAGNRGTRNADQSAVSDNDSGAQPLDTGGNVDGTTTDSLPAAATAPKNPADEEGVAASIFVPDALAASHLRIPTIAIGDGDRSSRTMYSCPAKDAGEAKSGSACSENALCSKQVSTHGETSTANTGNSHRVVAPLLGSKERPASPKINPPLNPHPVHTWTRAHERLAAIFSEVEACGAHKRQELDGSDEETSLRRASWPVARRIVDFSALLNDSYLQNIGANDLVAFVPWRNRQQGSHALASASSVGHGRGHRRLRAFVSRIAPSPETWEKFMLWVVMINALLLGIQIEVGPERETAHKVLDLLDKMILLVYVGEIICKLGTSSFRGYWRSGWNTFDFVLTMASGLPELLVATGVLDTNTDALQTILSLRTLRCLKLISRVPSMKVITRTIIEAFQSMASILVLLFLQLYIFAVIGVTLFLDYSFSSDASLRYREKFSGLGHAFLTLFQLLTLDNWSKIRSDMVRVTPEWSTTLYFILWVWLGAFVFRNIFVGVMVDVQICDVRSTITRPPLPHTWFCSLIESIVLCIQSILVDTGAPVNKFQCISKEEAKRVREATAVDMVARTKIARGCVASDEPEERHGHETRCASDTCEVVVDTKVAKHHRQSCDLSEGTHAPPATTIGIEGGLDVERAKANRREVEGGLDVERAKANRREGPDNQGGVASTTYQDGGANQLTTDSTRWSSEILCAYTDILEGFVENEAEFRDLQARAAICIENLFLEDLPRGGGDGGNVRAPG